MDKLNNSNDLNSLSVVGHYTAKNKRGLRVLNSDLVLLLPTNKGTHK